jgi:hypothetical protein
LTEAQAAAIPWAVETGERRRPGQQARLKRQIDRLNQQVREQEELLRRAGKKDPELQKAIESIRARGDNYIARNEPDPNGAPRDVLDAFDGDIIGPDPDVDPAELGMPGVGGRERKTAGTAGSTTSETDGGDQDNQ